MANTPFVLYFRDIDHTQRALVGGKGMHLAELTRITGIHVPDGFCVVTAAFQRIMAETPLVNGLLDRLLLLKADDRDTVRVLSREIRQAIEATVIPPEIAAAVSQALSRLGEKEAYAVRSSATAEDLPTASFAGQQDTYLNITGEAAILQHVSRCWASLFTERAVIYRMQNGFDHRKVSLAVVVQRMVFPQVAGIMFTADPVNGHRETISIDASFGLGEALVAGLVNADVYKVRSGKIFSKRLSSKKLAVYAVKEGGTKTQAIAPQQQKKPALTEKQILQLARAGSRIAAHFGAPQDIEWCLAGDTFYIVQSRPITTLFPAPEARDGDHHVYISVGHNQMMTDAMKPLGLSFFQLTTLRPMHIAGGRLFVDITPELASPDTRKKIIGTLGQSDPLTKDALMAICRRKDFIRPAPAGKVQSPAYVEKVLPWSYLSPFENNPTLVQDLVQRNEAALATLQQNIQTTSGVEVFDFIQANIPELRQLLFDPKSWEVIKVALYASAWLNRKMHRWLGEKNVADTLSQSVSNNVTSQMGLELMEVADVIRPYPAVIAYLQQLTGDHFLDGLPQLEGGPAAREAILGYLHKYGMRCAGEIDISRPRWAEQPSTLIPLLLNNIRNFAPHAGEQKFEKGRQEALAKTQELLDCLLLLPGGKRKASETKRMIHLLRHLIGYREYPKYGIINRYFVYRQALWKEAEKLVQAGVIREKEEVSFLTFEEFRETVRTMTVDLQLIDQRKEAFKLYAQLTPPRVITAAGEIITGAYKRKDLPAGALAGLAVSSGLVEGRARVILDMRDADIAEGDILVTSFTDPSWTPLFVGIKGLVTEVGGLMTHGAVIAREYGLPAVVGVTDATKRIKDGQQIRVHGTEGYVEVL